ncbi:MAG: hypothetical protein ACKVQA_06850 [Burkholderiales bacterium]
MTQIVSRDSNYLTQALQLIELIRDGKTVTEAGQLIGISRGTAFRRLQLVEDDTERGVVKLLNAKALDLTENWIDAARIAAEKGDHRPAKDALLHARAIEPIADSGAGGTRIAIVIGTPEQPIRIGPPQPIVVGTQDS